MGADEQTAFLKEFSRNLTLLVFRTQFGWILFLNALETTSYSQIVPNHLYSKYNIYEVALKFGAQGLLICKYVGFFKLNCYLWLRPFIKNPSWFYICTYRLASQVQTAFLFLHYSSSILTISYLTINISKGFSLPSRDLLKFPGSGSASVRMSCQGLCLAHPPTGAGQF